MIVLPVLGAAVMLTGCGGDDVAKIAEPAKVAVEETVGAGADVMDKAGDVMEKTGDAMKDSGEKMVDGAKHAGDAMKDSGEKMVDGAMDKAGDAMEKVDDAMVKDAPATVVDIAVGSTDHTTLVAAVTAAGLADTLSAPGPFTVFAPTDAAFEKLPAGTVEELLVPAAKADLAGILTYHVVPTKALAADVLTLIADGGGTTTVETVAGGTLTLGLAGDNVTVTDANGTVATVTATDIEAGNGVVHVIDSVLLP